MAIHYNALVLHKIFSKENIVSEKEVSFEDISIEAFKTILNNGQHCTSISSIHSANQGTMSKIMLSFDDGHKSDISIALPMLKKKGFKATFFIVPSFVGKQGFLDWDDIRALSSEGMEIGSHSMTHPNFRSLNYSDAREELYESKKIIESKTNTTINSFAFPFGYAPQRFTALAQDLGYKNIMGSHHGLISGPSSQILPRNSVHGRMSNKQIKNLLSPSQAIKLYWFFENTTKPIVKKVLPKSIYFRVRYFLTNGNS